MRPTFVLNADGHAVSALRPRECAHTIKPGAPVTFIQPYATPSGTVAAGSRGTVEYVDEREGTVWVRVDYASEALKHWDDMVVLSPFETEDLAECLTFSRQPLLTWRRVAIAASVPAAFILGAMFNSREALCAIATLVTEYF